MSPSSLARELALAIPTLYVVSATLAGALVRRLRRAISGPPNRPLRVGVDIRPFYEPLTGVGWYLWHILDELGRRDDVELVLFGDPRVTEDGPKLHASIPAGARLGVFDLRGVPSSRFSRPIVAIAYVGLIWIEGCDLVFGANYFLPRLMGAVARRRVVTIHDLTYRRHPELLQRETLDNLEREMAREIARADAIVCVSETTRRDLLEFYSVDPSRAHAILSGATPPPPPTSEDRGDLPGRYVLFVSTVEPRKDLDTLIDAFERLKDRGEYPGDLVVVGRVGWKAEETVRRMRESRWSGSIRHLDYVTRDRLATIYRNAEAFVMPSLYEGFGLPVLEAMGHGVPVIASRSSSLPEVGGDAALYFEPRNTQELAAAILSISASPETRARLAKAGRERVAQFRWDEAAAKTLDVFRRAAGAR
ncbi:MAG: glycosyltransferase family 4 protein [Thermoanaerobaculia bacterium]|nr:glycosyltransferase family 4 protein [Thermoanaerobaculia bacterium]